MPEHTDTDNNDAPPSDDGGASAITAYRKATVQPREGLHGRAARWVGDHPLWAGLIGGCSVVLVAALSAWEGVTAVPTVAALLSAIVIATWVVLFYFMGPFIARQGHRDVYETYELDWDGDELVWRRDDAVIRRLKEPVFELFADEGFESAQPLDGDPWGVWLRVEGRSGETLVVESRITAGEAEEYPTVDESVRQETDEELPIGVASPLLQQADRKLEVD